MKIIHTSDWHLGKIVNEMSMLDDQIYILDQLKDILREERPDALVIAGDLYDRSVPPARAVEVLGNFFKEVTMDLNIPVLSIGGNHDSGERLDFASGILMNQGLHIEGAIKGQYRQVMLTDEHGPVDFYLIPYADPAVARHVFNDETLKTHQDAMKKILENIRLTRNKENRSVMIAHGYVTFMSDGDGKSRDEILKEAELELSESERPLSIGGTDLISGKIFEGFNYVALGHLHGPQKVGSDRIRYSGSLLKYSFSEERQKKSVAKVEIGSDGEAKVEQILLKPKRDMRTIQGTLEELTSKEFYQKGNQEDYIYAFVTDDGELFEPISRLRSVYPNIMGVRRAENQTLEYQRVQVASDQRNKSSLELFVDFYENVTQCEFSEEREKCMEQIIEHVEGKVESR